MAAIASWVWRAVAVAGLTALVLTTTARVTLLDASFDAHAVGAADGYERVYTQVLPSPDVQAAIRDALTGLPVDPGYVTANVRLLLPRPVLEEVVRAAIASYVSVALGSSSGVDLDLVLQPVVDHLVHLVQELAPGALATAPRLHAGSLADFNTEVARMFAQWGEGEVRLRLPTIALRPDDVGPVATILTAGLPAATGVALRAQILPLLAAGDLSGAFALVAPAYLDDAALQRLTKAAAAGLADAVRSMPSARRAGLPRSGAILPFGLGWLTALGLLLSAALLRPLVSGRAGRAREVATTLALASVTTLVSGIVLAREVTDPLRRAAASDALDPASRSLLADIDHELRQGVGRAFLGLTALLLVAAAVVWITPLLLRVRSPRSRRIVAATATAALGAGAFATVALAAVPAPVLCNGSDRLCDRTYDQVAYLTAHNAMASSDRGFLGANQDPDLTGQLDTGVRGLMLDLHYWTTPAEAEPYLASLDPATRAALQPLVTSFEPRPGVWLCHDLCQLGADPAVDDLRRLGDWLDEHPDDVVTLILQDDVSSADVLATIKSAGLDRWLATPPSPGEPWPTLGELVSQHHTLVVFTQRAAPTSGPIRNFYTYAAETPYAAKQATDLSCAPDRGPRSAALFLLNNWIGSGIPTRTDALQVNSPAFLRDRIRDCQTQRGLLPTFVAVDFAQVGDPLQVVDELNGLTQLGGGP